MPRVAATRRRVWLGLAEKQETRQLISDHATIAEIATAARVAKKTVTNYFARKEDLALDHQDEFAATLARAVTARRSGESAFTALRRAFEAAVEARNPVAGFAGPDFSRMIVESPTLSACLRNLHDRREQALAVALADAVGEQPDDVTVRTAAGLLGALHRVLFQRIQDLTLAGHTGDEIAETVAKEATRAFDLLEPALADYAVAP